MTHDAPIFISYAIKDESAADKVCEALEADGLRCWYSGRDLGGGEDFGPEVIDAISECQVVLLILSSNANESKYVVRECVCADRKSKPILPLRIENVEPGKNLEFHLSAVNWVNAWTPPLESHLKRLIRDVRRLLDKTRQDQAPKPHVKQSNDTYAEGPKPPDNDTAASAGGLEDDAEEVTRPLPQPRPDVHPPPVEPAHKTHVEQVPAPPPAGAAGLRELWPLLNNRWVLGAVGSAVLIVMLIVFWRLIRTPAVTLVSPPVSKPLLSLTSPVNTSLASPDAGPEVATSRTEDIVPIAPETVVNERPDKGATAHAEGNIILREKSPDRYKRAAVKFEEAVSLESENPVYHYSLGSTLLMLNDYPEAADHFQEAARLDDNNYRYHFYLANALYNQGRNFFAEARKHYEAALARLENEKEQGQRGAERSEKRKKKLARYHDNLGDVLRDLGEFEEAWKHFSQAVALDKNSHVYQSDLGVALYKLKDYKQAQKAHEAALRLLLEEKRGGTNEDLSVPEARYSYYLGNDLREQGLLRADDCYRKAWDLIKDKPDLSFWAAVKANQGNQASKSSRCLTQVRPSDTPRRKS